MFKITYDEFEKAVETLRLIRLTSKENVRKNYLSLSKKYHPDMPEGDAEKFKEINKAYEVLTLYMDNFRFALDKEEFKDQYPFSVNSGGDWLYGAN